jgi:hypothetical protein
MLPHELKKERDLSAVFVSDPRSGRQSVTVQRELVDQVLARYTARLGAIDASRYSARVRDSLTGVRQRLDGLAEQRRAIDVRSLDLAGSLLSMVMAGSLRPRAPGEGVVWASERLVGGAGWPCPWRCSAACCWRPAAPAGASARPPPRARRRC